MDGHHTPLGYHQTLLRDTRRMLAYERAIRELVRPGMRVLDLGTGTGVLAMLAARRGATVHAVESAAVAGLATRLVADNGLSDRVVVHRGDVRTLPVAEEVDLVLGDFMGRYVVDDQMLEAMVAAGRWLKPDGPFCPRRLDLKLAPVDISGGALDVFVDPLLGLDLSAALPAARSYCYHTNVPLPMLLSGPEQTGRILPPRAPDALHASLRFTVLEAGVLGGFAGWFDAWLTETVKLSTSPGTDTHWGQVLFPIPRVPVQRGDHVHVDLRCDLSDVSWTWTGRVEREGDLLQAFEQESHQRLGTRPAVPRAVESGLEAVRRYAEAGSASSAAGDYADAVEQYGLAARALSVEEDPIAHRVYEGLGLAAFGAGRYALAARALLRAVDDRPAEREQALRYAVIALVNSGRAADAGEALRLYEGLFGPHPTRQG